MKTSLPVRPDLSLSLVELAILFLVSGCAGPSADRNAQAAFQDRTAAGSKTSRSAAAEQDVPKTQGVLRLVADDPAALRILKTRSLAHGDSAQPAHAVVVGLRGHAEATEPDSTSAGSDLRVRPAGFRENHAVVRAIRGQAECRVPGAQHWEKLNVGRVLEVGSSVRTGPDSEVDLFLKQNGPVVRLVPDSELRLRELAYWETPQETVIITILEVPRGNILGNVKKLAPASRYEIRTPKGITRVRGTLLSVSHAGWVTVFDGTAEFITPAGRFKIHAGETFDPERAVVRSARAAELDRVNALRQAE